MAELALSVTLTSIDCGECGGTYAINERYRQGCHREGRSWTCPYCKCSWGYAEGENARLKRQLAAEKASRQIAEQNAEQLRKQAQRLKRRAAAGTCPCCKRTFANVARHMKTKHPKYAGVNPRP